MDQASISHSDILTNALKGLNVHNWSQLIRHALHRSLVRWQWIIPKQCLLVAMNDSCVFIENDGSRRKFKDAFQCAKSATIHIEAKIFVMLHLRKLCLQWFSSYLLHHNFFRFCLTKFLLLNHGLDLGLYSKKGQIFWNFLSMNFQSKNIIYFENRLPFFGAFF